MQVCCEKGISIGHLQEFISHVVTHWTMELVLLAYIRTDAECVHPKAILSDHIRD